MQVPLLRNRKKVAVLMLFLILATLLPAAALAQPATPPTAPATPSPSNNQVVTKESLSAPKDDTPAKTPTPTIEEQAPAASNIPDPAASLDSIVPSVQGDIRLNISVPTTIRAGEPITYTYFYTNTTGAAVTPVIEAIWPSDILNVANPQFCRQSGNGSFCNVYPGTVVGPAVTRAALPSPGATSVRYNVASLGGNASGHFSVVMQSNTNIYPQTNAQLTRPPGSAKLYRASTPTTVISDDTTSTLVVGPVLVPTKTPATAGPIYAVVDTATFTITLGNATNTNDSSNGNIRADARPATNIVLRDTFPAGSSFVSATPSVGTFSTSGNVLTWSIPGPLAPGNQITLRVVYRKDDVANECGAISNNSYNVRSSEYPAGIFIAGLNSATVAVAPTMVISSAYPTPSAPVFGEQALVTIIVQNYWDQAIPNVQLNYTIQTNGYFMSASPTTPTTPPNPSNPGGTVSWTFTMPAGSKTVPESKTFSVLVRGGFTNQTSPATAQILLPVASTVPKQCINTREGTVGFLPRLSFVKFTDAPDSTRLSDCYIVNRGQQFPYILRVHNEGSTPVSGVTITDLFPRETDADFSYVDGSAEINGTSFPPSSTTNTGFGQIVWDGPRSLTIPAKATIDLKYKLVVQGRDYYNYHNFATPAFNTEPITLIGQSVCVKINPNIQITKVGDKTTAKPGETVRFTLRAHNFEQSAYQIGLVDILGSFQYVQQVSGYAPPILDTTYNWLEWPVQSVAAGGEIEAVIDVKVPDLCTSTTYVNEAIWQNATDYIQPVPRKLWGVQVICGQLHYQQAADNSIVTVNGAATVSLRDQITYRLIITNAHGEPLSNIQVEDQLPSGFTYVGMAETSDFKTAPQVESQSNGRTKLSWTIPSIPAQGTVNIRFVARAAEVVVGNSDPEANANWLIVPTNAICDGPCFTRSDQRIYSYMLLSVQPLITVEPSLTPNTCAQPGQNRTYKLSIVNTNSHIYSNTGITITLPLGLWFAGTLGDTPAPSTVSTDATGMTKISWSGLSIGSSSPFLQKDLEMNLRIGQVWGELHTAVQTTSPDGLIPLKDGATDVTVTVCPPTQTQGALAKEVSDTAVQVGDEIIYQISLANPTANPISTTITDQLPANMTYLEMVEGADPSSTSPLTWAVTVPAAADGKPGSVVIKFKVRVNSGEIGQSYPNTAQSSVPVDTTYATVGVAMPRAVYLALIAR